MMAHDASLRVALAAATDSEATWHRIADERSAEVERLTQELLERDFLIRRTPELVGQANARADAAEKQVERLKKEGESANVLECAACGVEDDRDNRSWICDDCAAKRGAEACKAEAERDALDDLIEEMIPLLECYEIESEPKPGALDFGCHARIVRTLAKVKARAEEGFHG